jgi:hypothetical protein
MSRGELTEHYHERGALLSSLSDMALIACTRHSLLFSGINQLGSEGNPLGDEQKDRLVNLSCQKIVAPSAALMFVEDMIRPQADIVYAKGWAAKAAKTFKVLEQSASESTHSTSIDYSDVFSDLEESGRSRLFWLTMDSLKYNMYDAPASRIEIAKGLVDRRLNTPSVTEYIVRLGNMSLPEQWRHLKAA